MRISDISYRYPQTDRYVLQDVSIAFKNKCVYGLIGPNGAGKTTLLSILAGIRKPLSGKVDTASIPGLLIQNTDMYEEASGRENLELFCIQARMPLENIDYVLHLVGVDQKNANKAYKNYSQGYKQRLLLARSFLPRKGLIILDEPFTNVDVDTIKIIKRAIDTLVCQNEVVVILSSHQLREIEDVVDEVIFVSDGKVVAEVNYSQENLSEHNYVVINSSDTLQIKELVENTGLIKQVEIQDKWILLELSDQASCNEILYMILRNGCSWVKIEKYRPLEYMYHKFIGDAS